MTNSVFLIWDFTFFGKGYGQKYAPSIQFQDRKYIENLWYLKTVPKRMMCRMNKLKLVIW